MISMLSFDVYMKKQLVEALIDENSKIAKQAKEMNGSNKVKSDKDKK